MSQPVPEGGVAIHASAGSVEGLLEAFARRRIVLDLQRNSLIVAHIPSAKNAGAKTARFRSVPLLDGSFPGHAPHEVDLHDTAIDVDVLRVEVMGKSVPQGLVSRDT